MNKKGLELAINTIVILVLAMFFLVAIIFFFTGSFSNFTDKIKGISGDTNVDSVVKGCNILVDTDSRYGYCCEKKLVKYIEDGDKVEGEFSCNEIVDKFSGVKKLDCSGVSC